MVLVAGLGIVVVRIPGIPENQKGLLLRGNPRIPKPPVPKPEINH